MTTITYRSADVDGFKIFSREAGSPDAPKLLLLHGFPSASGANPIAIVAPCHRVIGADASLTGNGGGVDRKQWLLLHEGAAFENMARRIAKLREKRRPKS